MVCAFILLVFVRTSLHLCDLEFVCSSVVGFIYFAFNSAKLRDVLKNIVR